jgi:hypothetical protein
MTIQESLLIPHDNIHCVEIIKVMRTIGKSYYDNIETEIKYIITSEMDRVVNLSIFEPAGTFMFRKGKKYIIIKGENYLDSRDCLSMTEMLFKDKLPPEKTPSILSTAFFPKGEFKRFEENRVKFFSFENFIW